MRLKIGYIAFGWLTTSGILHFIVDVISQHVRGKRTPSLETTYYYGLHSAYALSQVLFGTSILILLRTAPTVLYQWPMKAISIIAFIGWAAICLMFIEYREPKINLIIFGILGAWPIVASKW